LAGFSLTNAQVILRADGQSDISGAPTSSAPTTLTATFHLSGAAIGYRDVIITPQNGPEVTLSQGFLVSNVSTCNFNVSYTNASVAASGATIDDVYVTPNPVSCAWNASTSAPWITIGQPHQNVGYWNQPITIAPNPDASQ
jgi:hypothetical protein